MHHTRTMWMQWSIFFGTPSRLLSDGTQHNQPPTSRIKVPQSAKVGVWLAVSISSPCIAFSRDFGPSTYVILISLSCRQWWKKQQPECFWELVEICIGETLHRVDVAITSIMWIMIPIQFIMKFHRGNLNTLQLQIKWLDGIDHVVEPKQTLHEQNQTCSNKYPMMPWRSKLPELYDFL